jgi:Zn-dependent M16 (insulinase) family peptidase
VLLPQQGLEEKWQAESSARLSNIKAAFSKEEQSGCLSNTKKLLAWQSQADDPEALRKIPVLERSDIKPQADEISCQLNNEGNLDFLYLARFPNQIAYLQLYFAAEALPEELLPYAYLLKDLLGRLATKKYGHAELAKNINTFTGGLFFDLQSFPHKDDANRYSPKFIVSGKALRRNIGKLCAILGEVLTNSLFDDRERLRDLIEERKAGWDAELFGRGQAVVLARLQSYFSRSGQYDDSGLLEYYRFLNALQRANMAKVAEKLRRTAAALFSGKGLLAACCCAQEDKDAVYAALRQTLALLPEREGGTRPYLFGKDGINEGIIAPAQVQYVAAGGNFAQHGYGYKGSMRVLEHILRYDYFWNNIRAKGGAYGANARFDCNGNTVFHSYRDPNLAETLAVFQATPAYLQSFSPGEREMRKYIIGTVSQLDRPLSPSLQLEKAAEDYFRGITQEIRQKVRDEVINCTAGDIRALAAPVQALLQDGYRCVLGAEGKIKANKNIFGAIMAALPH